MTDAQSPKIINMMQFARKAGKLVAGIDACMRGLHRKHIHLIVVASDSSDRTVKRVKAEAGEYSAKLPVISLGNQIEMSAALGLPKTGVFGISDKNIAAKIMDLWQA